MRLLPHTNSRRMYHFTQRRINIFYFGRYPQLLANKHERFWSRQNCIPLKSRTTENLQNAIWTLHCTWNLIRDYGRHLLTIYMAFRLIVFGLHHYLFKNCRHTKHVCTVMSLLHRPGVALNMNECTISRRKLTTWDLWYAPVDWSWLLIPRAQHVTWTISNRGGTEIISRFLQSLPSLCSQLCTNCCSLNA